MAALAKVSFARGVCKQYVKCCACYSSGKLPPSLGSEGHFYRPLTQVQPKEDRRDYPLEMILFLHANYDFSYTGYKKWKQHRLEKALAYDQRFIQHRLDILGPDLAAAHFLVHRGGGVRFQGSQQWIRRDAEGRYSLPKKYIPDLFVEAMDVHRVPLLYTGLINLENLQHCRWISLRESPRVDDFFLDWLATYKDTLEYLDISGCSQLTERGVASLARLRNLRFLNLSNLVRLRHPELVCLLLEDELPNCEIVGIDYMNPNVLHLAGNDPNEPVLEIEPQVEKKLIE